MLELGAVVGTDIEDGFFGRSLEKSLVYFLGNPCKMLAEGTSDPGEVGMVTKHRFFGDGEIKLGCFTVVAVHNLQGIKRFLPDFLLSKEMVAPGLGSQIDDRIQSGRITYAADHDAVPVLITRPSKITSDPWAPSSTCVL